MWITALALVFAQASPELAPRSVTWADLTTTKSFPASWRLPEELWRAPDGSNDAKLLPIALKKLIERDFDASLAPGDSQLAGCRNFGDCVAQWRKRGGDKAALRALLDELRKARPTLARELEPMLTQLLQDDALRGKWDPGSDRDDDGMYFGKPIDLRASKDEPWKSMTGTRRLQQAAVLAFADLDALKGAENDFPAAAKDRGARYDFIGPAANSYVRGEDTEHGPFAAHHVRFRYDLPFPFSHFDCDLAVLSELDREHHVTTFIYSDSKDMLWLAGQDFLWPVRTSSGEWIGTLLVRLYGFDLAGVPDGDDNRAESLRGSLGNLKRRAEERFKSSGGAPRTVDGAIPEYALLGEPRK